MFRWGRIKLTSGEGEPVRTDVILYSDRSYLLLPGEEEENRFLVKSRGDHVEFYVGSSSLENYNLMKGFFTKLYSCEIEDEEEVENTGLDGNLLSLVLKNAELQRKRFTKHYPGFLRNIIYMPSSVEGLELEYSIVIRSYLSFFKKKRFNFIALLHISYDRPTTETILGYMRNELKKLRRESNWKISIAKRGRVRFRRDLLDDTSVLYNFMRIPIDEEP